MISGKTSPFPAVIVKRSRLCLIHPKAGPPSIGCFLHQSERGITPIDEPVIPNFRFVHRQSVPDLPVMIPIFIHTIAWFLAGRAHLLWITLECW